MSFRVSQRIERNRDALVALHKLSETSKRAILSALSKDTLFALVECAKNIVIGNVTLNELQLRYMRRHKQELIRLVKKRETENFAKKVIFDEHTDSFNTQEGETYNRPLH